MDQQAPAAPAAPAPEGAKPKSDLKFEPEYSEKISRLFIFRFLWVYIEIWVMMVWGFWINLVNFVHFWYMLILGKRQETLWKKNVRFMRNMVKWQSYLNAMTDKRPDFVEKE